MSAVTHDQDKSPFGLSNEVFDKALEIQQSLKSQKTIKEQEQDTHKRLSQIGLTSKFGFKGRQTIGGGVLAAQDKSLSPIQ